MASLLNDEAMAGQVDLIYMDPPYNINFRSNFQGLMFNTNVGDKWEDIPQDVRPVKAFRDSYENGVHSYLDQLRVQLIHGRELLKESGSFVMQIGPDNLHYIAVLMSEVFGHDNHVATIPYATTTNSSTKMLPEIGNWLIWFAKDKASAQSKYRQLYETFGSRAEAVSHMAYDAMCETASGERRNLTAAEKLNPDLLPKEAKIFRRMPLDSAHPSNTGRSNPFYRHPGGISCHGTSMPNDALGGPCGSDCRANSFPCPPGRQWSVSLSGLHSIAEQDRMIATSMKKINYIRYEDEAPGRMLSAHWSALSAPRDKRYIVETPPDVLQRILLMTTDPGDLVLDPTCGSGAMPLMAERWGRRWIAIDSSAVSIAIARERIATAIHDYHLLQDSPDGHAKEHELSQALLPIGQQTKLVPKSKYGQDPAHGFVLERQFHISASTLAKGIYNNPPIYHPDRPHKAKGIRRISSTFTVESDLPFSSIQPNAFVTNDSLEYAGSTETLHNIEKALEVSGIRGPKRSDGTTPTYQVIDLEPTVEIPDATHTGQIADDGEFKDALFYICQEDEVAGTFQARNLAAVARSRRTPYACIIGFGHEGDTSTLVQHQGNITILIVTANRDLMIPDLSHQPSDHAFFVISEPDLAIHNEPDGKLSIEVRGLTTYNPATSQVEPSGDRKIAGILTDTNYDRESFKVRLLNLPHSGQTTERRLRQIRQAFRHQIDNDKWERMRSARTLPFDNPGAGGKIAVKVIDHIGMEHMTVLDAPL